MVVPLLGGESTKLLLFVGEEAKKLDRLLELRLAALMLMRGAVVF